MVVVIKKGSSKETIKRLLKKLSKKQKGFDPKKHAGFLKLDESPVEVQRRLRDEWG